MTTTIDTEQAGPADAPSNVIALRPRGGASAAADDAVATAGDARLAHDDPGLGELPDDLPPLEHQLEALLFISPTPLSLATLADATGEDEEDLRDCLTDMMAQYSESTRGIVLEQVAGGWAFRAADNARPVLARLMRPQADTKVSPSALETLSIVAYLQPISRPDVARIRGVSVDAAMSNLLERGFVEEAGRSDTGAVLFRTTALFERAFGLPGLGSLPELDGFGPGESDVARLREQLEQMAAARVD